MALRHGQVREAVAASVLASGRETLRRRIDEMSNAEYQRLLRSEASEVRERLPGEGHGREDVSRLVADLDDAEVTRTARDLGGRDLVSLLEAYREADTAQDRPEWTLLHTLSRLGREDGCSSYFRLSTRPIEQSLAKVPQEPVARERRRREVLAGGYRLRDSAALGLDPSVTLVGTGAIIPGVLRAAELLQEEGNLGADVVCLTSADLIFRAWRTRQGLEKGEYWILDTLFPRGRRLPIVSVMDGHPHTLSFLGAIQGVPVSCLGVNDFGQSGDIESLYEHYGIDTETVIGAALDVIG